MLKRVFMRNYSSAQENLILTNKEKSFSLTSRQYAKRRR